MSSRVQVNGPGGQEPLRPAAQPVDTYFRPNLTGPRPKLLYDFREFSDNLRSLLSAGMDNEIKRKDAVGEAWVAQNPDLAKQINDESKGGANWEETQSKLQAAFGKLVRSDQIPEGASPFFLRGFARASAQSALGAYQRNVEARVSEVTNITDPQTGLESTPVAPQQILAEEWAKIADNPSLKNFYGQQVAADLKPKLDAEFLGIANKALVDAKAQRFKETLSVNVSGQVDALAAKGKDVTAADLQGFSDYVTENLHKTNVKDPRGVTWDGVRLAIKRLANTDPGEALRVLDLAGDIKVGGLELRKDAKIGLEFEELKHQLIYQQKSEEDHQRSIKSEARQEAIVAGRNYYLGVLNPVAQSNGNLRLAADALATNMRDKQMFGDFTEEVIAASTNEARALEHDRGSDGDVMSRFNTLITAGDADGAEALRTAAIKNGSMTGQDILTTHTLLNNARNISSKQQGSESYDETTKGIERAAAWAQDLQPEARRQYDRQAQEDLTAWRRERLNLIKTHVGDTNLNGLLEELDTNKLNEFKTKMNTAEDAMRVARDAFQAKLDERHSHFMDGRELIDGALREGAITRTEAEVFRTNNAKRIERMGWLNSPEVTRGRARIEQEIAGNSALSDEQKRGLADEYGQLYDATFLRTINERLPKADETTITSDIHIAAREAQEQVMGQLGAGAQSVIKAGVEAGKSATEISKERTPVEADAQRAKVWQDIRPDKFAPEQLAHDPNLEPRVYKDVAKLVQWDRSERWTPTPLVSLVIPQYNPRGEAEYSIWKASLNVLNNGALDDKSKAAAILRAKSFVGLTADEVLRDTITVAPPEAARRAAEEENHNAAKTSGVLGFGPLDRQFAAETQRRIDERTALIAPREVSIKGLPIDPFTTPLFKSTDELKAFALTRAADFDKLLTRLGVATDQTSKQEWINYQRQAIQRTRDQ